MNTGETDAGNARAEQTQFQEVSAREQPRNGHGRQGNDASDERQTKQISINRRRSRVINRLAERVAVDQSDPGERRERGNRRHELHPQHQHAERDDTEPDPDFRNRHGLPMHVQADTGHHRQHKSDSETADRHDRRKVIDPNDRMAEPRQDALEVAGVLPPIR